MSFWTNLWKNPCNSTTNLTERNVFSAWYTPFVSQSQLWQNVMLFLAGNIVLSKKQKIFWKKNQLMPEPRFFFALFFVLRKNKKLGFYTKIQRTPRTIATILITSNLYRLVHTIFSLFYLKNNKSCVFEQNFKTNSLCQSDNFDKM